MIDEANGQFRGIGIGCRRLAQPSAGAVKAAIAQKPACALSQGQRDPITGHHLLDLLAIPLLDDLVRPALRQARKVSA
ncbi:hypothetical protein D3C76_1529240 [compost metagenome]